jgi:hypothetical protein
VRPAKSFDQQYLSGRAAVSRAMLTLLIPAPDDDQSGFSGYGRSLNAASLAIRRHGKKLRQGLMRDDFAGKRSSDGVQTRPGS